MKNIKWSSLFIGLICLCSCVDLTELNENPTKATSISPHLLIPTIQLTHSQYTRFEKAFINSFADHTNFSRFAYINFIDKPSIRHFL